MIALLECFLIQTLQRLLRNQAVLHERILEAFLCALSLGDVSLSVLSQNRAFDSRLIRPSVSDLAFH